MVPVDFTVPEKLDCGSYHLRMLSIDDVAKDFEAVVASRDRLIGLLDPGSSWPDGLTLNEDLIDLAWHQREFTLRHSFAYTVMSADETRCLGCTYIFPSNAAGYDAVVYYWVRTGVDAQTRDDALGVQVRQWLAVSWPFKSIAFPGRDISWPDWNLLQSHY
jgi:hypothetical protein